MVRVKYMNGACVEIPEGNHYELDMLNTKNMKECKIIYIYDREPEIEDAGFYKAKNYDSCKIVDTGLYKAKNYDNCKIIGTVFVTPGMVVTVE